MHLMLVVLASCGLLFAILLNLYDLRIRSKRLINERGQFDDLSISGNLLSDDDDEAYDL
jgi:biopolymer transport protein ExbB/TolQ